MKKCSKCDLNWINDDEEFCSECCPKILNHKSDNKDFYSMGLKTGDEIIFILEPKYKAKICSDRKVIFEGNEYSVTNLAYKLALKIGMSKKQAINTSLGGFGCFKFDDKDKHLYERYERYKKLNGKVT